MAGRYLDTVAPFGFAHQGGTDVAAGNTVASFDHAAALGYRYIETDVQVTSDGVLALFHDDDLEPTTGVPGPVSSRTWAELAEIRVAGSHPIPRFDEVLDRYPAMRFNVEPKSDQSVDPLIDLIRRRQLADRIGVGSFSGSRVARLRAAVPGLATSPGPWGIALILLMALVWPRWRPRHTMVQIPRRAWVLPLASRFWIRRYHRMGLQVHVWTINEEADMRALLDAGVDAIMSDRTELLRSVLEQRGAWPPAGEGSR